MEQMDRIFEESIQEFKESGVKFTMDSLAKRVGISKRTLYETIPSKEALVEMVIDKTFEDVKEQQKHILEDETLSTVDKLKKLFNVVPTYASVLDYRRINEIRTAFPKLYKKIEEKLESDWEPTIELMEKAVTEGVMRDTNIVIVKFLLCEVYEQLINGETLIRNNISYEQAMHDMIDIIFNGLLVKERK